MASLPASLGVMGTGLVTGNPIMAAAGATAVAGPPIAGRTLMSRPVQNWLARQGPRNFTPALGGAATSLFDMQ